MSEAFSITELGSGVRFNCLPNQSVLRAMEHAGGNCVPVGCRGGGCGLCKVQVLRGEYQCGPMSSKHVSESALACGEVLACRIYPRSDLTIERRTPKATVVTQQQIQ